MNNDQRQIVEPSMETPDFPLSDLVHSCLPLHRLNGESAPLTEFIRSHNTSPGHHSAESNIIYNESYAFSWTLSEAKDFLVEDIATKAYLKMITELRALDIPNLARCWNVIPRINEAERGLERYKLFCIGRETAFSKLRIHKYPAASAVGFSDKEEFENKYFFAVLSSKNEVQELTNPRQIEAYHYPEIYGPQAPSFARATMMDNNLNVSGTAAIIGHQSCFPNDLNGQLNLCLEHLELLCAQFETRSSISNVMSQMRWRVFLRNAEDLNQIQETLKRYGIETKACDFYHADICRAELLLEIEGDYFGI